LGVDLHLAILDTALLLLDDFLDVSGKGGLA